MQHPSNALTAVRVSKLAKPGRYADGNGLYLVVDGPGAKRWVLRTVVRQRRRDMGLGSARLVSLADARALAQKYRGIARSGGDPLQERRQHHEPVPNFEVAAVETHKTLLPTWRDSKHGEQWMNTLSRYVFPVIGDRPVGQVSSADVLRVLTPIWAEKAETARRVSQRIAAVVRWARASGYYTGEDPVEGAKAGLPKHRRPVKHHRSLGYSEIPDLVLAVRHSTAKSISKCALEFLILGVSRTKEVREALWDEIDLAEKLWVVPTP